VLRNNTSDKKGRGHVAGPRPGKPTCAPDHLLGYSFQGEPTEDQTEVVVLIRVLTDEVNVGYQGFLYEVLSGVNGVRIKDLSSLVQAIESNTGPYLVFLTEAGEKIALNREKAEESEERIARNYRILSS
jgi:hypothetical protein